MSEAGQRFSRVTIVTGIVVPLVAALGVPVLIALFDEQSDVVSAARAALPVNAAHVPEGVDPQALPAQADDAVRPEPDATRSAPASRAPVSGSSAEREGLTSPQPWSDGQDAQPTSEADASSGDVVEVCNPPMTVQVELQAGLSQVLLTPPDSDVGRELDEGQMVELSEGCNVLLRRIAHPLRGSPFAQLEW